MKFLLVTIYSSPAMTWDLIYPNTACQLAEAMMENLTNKAVKK